MSFEHYPSCISYGRLYSGPCQCPEHHKEQSVPAAALIRNLDDDGHSDKDSGEERGPGGPFQQISDFSLIGSI